MVTRVGSTVLKPNLVLPGNESLTIPKGTTAQAPSPVNGMLRYDETTNKFRVVENGVWVDGVGGGGSSIFSDLAAATAANTINNGDHQQIWNWSLTTLNKVALSLAENVASTGVNSKILEIATLAGSTASPILVSIGGQAVFQVMNTGSVSLIATDDAGNALSLAAGSGGASSQGGVVSIAAGYAGTGSAPNRVGGSVNIEGGSGQNSDNIGDGGYVEIRGGGADPTQGNGGYVWMYGGNSDTLGGGGYVLIEGGSSAVEGNGGNLTLNGGNGAGTGTPGSLMLNGGTSDLLGGAITIQGGAAGGTDQSGGNVVIVSGDCTGNNGFSEVDLRSGLLDSGTMTASLIAVQTPSNDGMGNKSGGSIVIQGGDGDDGATPEDAQGGGINIFAGYGGLTGGNGGTISIYAGGAQGGNDDGGDAVIGAGAADGTGQHGSVMLVANNTNVQLTGTGSLAHWHPSNTLQTTDTDGFLYIRGMPGVPTGTPNAYGTSHPLAWDSSGSALYVYDTAWHKLATVDAINIYTKTQISEAVSLGHNTAWDASDNQHLMVNVNGSAFTVANPTNQQNQAYYSMYIEFTTTHSVSFGNAFKGLAGYTPSATAGKKDHLTFRSDGTNLMCTGIATDIGA
jgi:hypothetical protein